MRYVLFAAIVGVATEAGAASITYTTTTDTITQMGEFPMFDPSFGTLQEVDFAATGTISAGFMVQPTGVTAATFNADVYFTLLFPANTLFPGFASESVPVSIDSPNGGQNILANFNFNASSSAPDISAYVGTGQGNLQIAGDASISPNVATLYYFGGSANASLTYVYTVDPSPEPSSFAMVTIGLSILITFKEHRKWLSLPRSRKTPL